MKKYILILTILLFANFVSAIDCSKYSVEQRSLDVKCDGSPFYVEFKYNGWGNSWGNADIVRMYGSSGVFFYTYPEIDLTKISKDNILIEMSCYKVDNGYMEIKIYNKDQKFCTLKKELNISNPKINSNGEIVLNPSNLSLEVKKKNTITDWIIIIFGSIIVAILVFRLVLYPAFNKKI